METQIYKYPTIISGNKEDLIKHYINDVNQKNKNFNKNPNIIRLMIYNVQCFNFIKNSKILITELIKNLNIDVVSFIEYRFNKKNDEHFQKYFNNNCNYIQKNTFGIKTYSKLEFDCINNHTVDIDYDFDGEKRGFTHVEINGYNLISTHLDVWDDTGKTREKEIKVIIDYIQKFKLKNVILTGDFNEVNTNLFSRQYKQQLNDEFKNRTGLNKLPSKIFKLLKENEFIDMFDSLNKEHPKFSCWTGKLVDYAYIYKPTWSGNLIDIDLYYCPYSDHLPIIIDLI
jgi:endonuclease/exonuclease/phosphatase family metal-dependent hydrolase